ncbi:hypothetical protein HPP92_027131 [Vanilla planifolia]|uniref:Uncharacterized protein n=1 Tax=Vanilla planifolia TaxID=51239 RepID=A0A835PCV6_VANPL|nr:hypothetical protein HPP92_027131 [Vanilla planifolia]
MAAKGVVREVVDWKSSRTFFYKRLNRRVSEWSLIKSAKEASGEELSDKSALELIKNWFLASGAEWVDDEAFFAWKDDAHGCQTHLKELRAKRVLSQLSRLGESASDLDALRQGLAALLSKVDPSSRGQLIEDFTKLAE